MKIKSTFLATISAISLFATVQSEAVEIEMGVWQPGSVGNYRANPIGDFESILDNYTLGKSTDGTWFGTFCIEKNEYFTPGDTYQVEFNDGAISGGVSGAVGGKDIISKGTAYLYKNYALGTLAGLDYGSSSALYNLQNAIWYLEGETRIGMNPGSSFSSFIDIAMNGLGLDLSGIKSDYTGNQVQVMNLTSRGGTLQHQDQLVLVSVPDSGSTIALLGLATFGLAAVGRRRNKK
ncbi:VPDSG-CTERM sorting domain-containing protein [Pelagicoccus albus]|uniref:VPDSG-CTERM sorting domain-containing protein n=1 Tax=Pelagicoccus albus TaxID=415222 RepID=A0A7X1B546_9BACT|nr:VPDSG-CTERM sorting domain-containing protein [Pelagicoccus albus]MBC2605813.1 VPDSG-CTERM sorting domain-containing protein [Pelagicoccus albus]